MASFIRKNELGIEFECHIVAYTKYGDEDYIIYTDFLSDENGLPRLLSAKRVGNDVYKIDEKLSKQLVDSFKKDKEKIYNESLVMVQ